jgi:glycosyltransferase involved in cell wall biosynthesis
LPHLYNIADCFIIAGTAELQSLVTLEAMSCGLPILGVNAMALPELVHDGVNGYQFEIGDSKDLSEKIMKVFSDKELRTKMGIESKNIVAHHDIGLTIKAYENIYNEVLQNK